MCVSKWTAHLPESGDKSAVLGHGQVVLKQRTCTFRVKTKGRAKSGAGDRPLKIGPFQRTKIDHEGINSACDPRSLHNVPKFPQTESDLFTLSYIYYHIK